MMLSRESYWLLIGIALWSVIAVLLDALFKRISSRIIRSSVAAILAFLLIVFPAWLVFSGESSSLAVAIIPDPQLFMQLLKISFVVIWLFVGFLFSAAFRPAASLVLRLGVGLLFSFVLVRHLFDLFDLVYFF